MEKYVPLVRLSMTREKYVPYTPSGPDEKMTGRMEEAGKLLGIPVKDHIIIGDGYYSFRERGKLSGQSVSEYLL